MKNKFIPLLLSASLIIAFPCSSYATEIAEPEKPDINNEQQVEEYNQQNEIQEQINNVNTQDQQVTTVDTQDQQVTTVDTQEQQTKTENTQEQKVQTESKTVKTLAAPAETKTDNEPKEEITFPFKVTYHFVYKLSDGTTAEKTSSKTVNNVNYTGTINLPSFSPREYKENGHTYKYTGTFEGLSKVIVKGSELTSHDIYLNADYKMVPIITMTFICKDVNGEDVISSTSNNTDNWTIGQAKANNAIQNYKTYTKGSVKYTFSYWEFTNWDGKDFPIELKNITEDLEITATAIYDKTYLYDVTGHYIYLTSLGNKENGASTVEGSGDSYSHEFRTPPDIPSQYTFLYWKNFENGDIKTPGKTITVDKTNLTKKVEFTYYAVYDFQPQVKLIYHYKEGIKDTGAKSEAIDIYGNQPKDLKWFYNEEGGEPIPEGEVIPLPDIIPEVRTLQDSTPVRKDVYAHYYTVTWQDWDENLLEKDLDVPYGEMPLYNGETPIKEATPQYTYTFDKWTPEINPVTEDIIYTATYTQTTNTYKVIWQDWDETILEEDLEVPYGDLPSYDGIIPTKAATSEYTYEFIGWEPEIEMVTGDMIYTAIYKESLIPVPPEDPKVPEDPEEPKKPENPKEPENPEEPTLPTTPTTTVRQIWPPTFSSSTVPPVLSVPTTITTPKSNKTTIKEKTVPLSKGKKEQGTWALINLILTILTIISWIVLLVLNFKENRRKLLPLLVGLLTSILAVLMFILTEDITLPMVLIDKWTIIMLIIFLIELPLLFIKHEEEEEEEE